jgi:mannose/cellobiose epimerase-like protein (N-acyl-D-glucosamine 2-epimerase family)
MIALGAAFRFLELTGDKKYLLYGLEYLDYILANHVNIGQQPNCPGEIYDMWEFTHENLNPYYDADGQLLSDPGHATEFTGLAGKLLFVAEQKGLSNHIDRLAEYKTLLPAILHKNFNNGFSASGFGICKAVDLISRKSINADMPWWPLPETMRSACMAMNYGEPAIHASCHEIFKKCSDAFRNFFVRKDLHMMAYQTLDANGIPIDVIPATPDADPGYHTNLSIIDCLPYLENFEMQ